MASPRQFALTLTPEKRFDLIDVAERIRAQHGDVLGRHRRAFYCSLHTTAGYLDQSQCERLDFRLDRFFRRFQRIFPEGADYEHDKMHLREELSEAERAVEPRNGDSHLTFISAGLRNCVCYTNRPGQPVFFVDLDGVNEGTPRTRHTTVLAFDEEEVIDSVTWDVPTTDHEIDSVNLRHFSTGFDEVVGGLLARWPIESGRIELELDADETDVGITVNEYETLLMRHDLAEVLNNPVKFMAYQGRRMLADPRAIPAKSMGYARYDVVQLLKQVVIGAGLQGSFTERTLTRLMAIPARRRLRFKRAASLLVSDAGQPGRPRIVSGRYQSPILIQWRAAKRQRRRLRVTLRQFR